MLCTVCEQVELTGMQRKYCSHRCKGRADNSRNQNYSRQQSRGKERKLEAIRKFGGCCTVCGYKRNWAALTFHHLRDKEITLDLRSFSNNSQAVLDAELEKCVLLCENCHREEHNPGCTL